MNKTSGMVNGLVLCGGNSTRMGADKCLLRYHGKPQCYHLYDMLQAHCDDAYLSCNDRQTGLIDKPYRVITDIPDYGDHGPVVGLLTAFSHFPDRDLLVIACDYPLLAEKDLVDFLHKTQRTGLAAAFYNQTAGIYEPVLAWYARHTASMLLERFKEGRFSLQQFLKAIDAEKYEPADVSVMISVDTQEMALTIFGKTET